MTMPRVCRYCLARLTDMEREFCSKKDCRCYARIDARAPKGGYEIGQVAMPKDRLLSMIDRDLSIQKDLGVLTSLTLLATKVRKYVWDDCSAFLGERNEIVDRARRASTSPQLAPGETASYDKTTGTWRVTPSVSPSQTRDQISIFDDRPRPLAADAAPAFHVDASGRDIASKECKCDSGGPDHSPTMPHVPCRVCGRRYLGTSVHGSLNGCGRTDCPVLPQEPTLPTFQTTKVYDDVIGTMFQPNARWVCQCSQSNVTRLGVPLRAVERMTCKRCHKLCTIRIDMSKVPREWGGRLEGAPFK